MLKWATGMRAKRGFTLIEILVVIVIIGVTISFAMLSFGDFGASRKAQVSAEQFISYLKLIQHQAILTDSTLGIRLDKEGYQSLRYDQSLGWQNLSGATIFQKQLYPTGIIVTARPSSMKVPAITVNSSGEISDFHLDFGTLANPSVAVVILKPNGQPGLLESKKP